VSATSQLGPNLAARQKAPADGEPPRWVVPALLAVPFLIVVAASRGLTQTVQTFHGGDETVYHYPTIVRFAHQWPNIDLVHYPAAQTPLFHILMATLSKVVGLEIWRLRLFSVLISYLAALMLLHLLRRRRGLELPAALVLTLLVVLSPYVFGDSFLLLTDNMALGLIFVAIDQLERFRERPRLLPFAFAALAACAAVLTRQSTVFVFVIAFGYLVLASPRLRWWPRLEALGLLGLAAVPMGLLALAWGGLVPIGADSSSCGLCGTGAGRVDQAGAGVFVRSVGFTLAAAGVYGAVLLGPALVLRWRRGQLGTAELRAARPVLAGAVALAALLLLAGPLRSHVGDAGWLWRVADHSPELLGSSLLFWLLTPIGAVVLALRWRAAPRDWLAPLFLGAFLLVALTTRLGYQKYYDPYALLALVFTIRPREMTRAHYLGVAVLIAGSIAYMLSFVVGLNAAVKPPH